MSQLAVIPFSGFYNTWADQDLEEAAKQMFSDDQGNLNEGLYYRTSNIIKWRQVYEAYAKEYAEIFGLTFEIPSLKFEELNSPREYNFTTDRIFVRISQADIGKIFERVDDRVLTEVCLDMFTSRSGFSSFYDPDWRTWGEPEEWDHNQLLALLTALRSTISEPEWGEAYVMEDAGGNGKLDDWIYNAMSEPERSRIFKVWDYMREKRYG